LKRVLKGGAWETEEREIKFQNTMKRKINVILAWNKNDNLHETWRITTLKNGTNMLPKITLYHPL
jgi:hypothetical protein